jgi:outer membrane immunogenic protein
MATRLVKTLALALAGTTGWAATAAADPMLWKGAHVDAYGGLGMEAAAAQTTVGADTYFADSSEDSINSQGASSLIHAGAYAGLGGGYDLQFSRLVTGLEADFGSLPLYSENQYTVLYPDYAPATYTIRQTLSSDWLLSVRPRLGYAFGPWLLDLSAGLALTQLRYEEQFSDTYGSIARGSGQLSKVAPGFIASLGGAYALTPHWQLRADYLFADFGQYSTTSNNLVYGGSPYTGTIFNHSFSTAVHVLRVGVGYHF